MTIKHSGIARRLPAWLAASLDSANSGHVLKSKNRHDDINITKPVISSRCHISKPTAHAQNVTTRSTITIELILASYNALFHIQLAEQKKKKIQLQPSYILRIVRDKIEQVWLMDGVKNFDQATSKQHLRNWSLNCGNNTVSHFTEKKKQRLVLRLAKTEST